MLFILSGDVQSGKTRWLMRLIEELEKHDVCVCGVVAPGIWIRHEDDASPRFEKTGIDNLLLPNKKLIPFATRKDLATEEKLQAAHESEEARLSWVINDDALFQVNKHFDNIKQYALQTGKAKQNSLLIVDELGRLEFNFGKGLSSALSLIDEGESLVFRHSLIVVRDSLKDAAFERFSSKWQDISIIEAGECDFKRLCESFS